MQLAPPASAEPAKMVLEEIPLEGENLSDGRHRNMGEKLCENDMRKYAIRSQNCTEF
jgi:hypothetical protein